MNSIIKLSEELESEFSKTSPTLTKNNSENDMNNSIPDEFLTETESNNRLN